MDGISEEKIKWFKEQNFEIQLYPEKTVKKFSDPERLRLFILAELEYWKGFPEVYSSFSQSSNGLKSAWSVPDDQERTWQANFKDTVHRLKSAEQNTKSGSSYMLFSTTRAGKTAHTLLQGFGKDAAMFFLYYGFRNAAARIENSGQLAGALEAYIFTKQGAHLKAAIKKNTEAFDEIHSELDVFFDQCEKDAKGRASEFLKLKAIINKWKADEIAAVEQQRAEFQTSHEGRGLQHNEEFVQSMKDWKQKVSDLEELYESKLQLEEPVKYWDQLRVSHSRWGIGFSACTALVGILLICIFYNILYTWPPQWLEGNKWDLNTVKGTILLLTMTSVGLYLISLGAKFAVSSFHLARDAQERRQLTYIYLSLIQKEAIQPEEQKIVLQALFSRANTGLLKGDYGPTMPGADLLGKIKG